VMIGYLLLGVAIYFAAVNWPALRRRPEILGWGVLGVGSALSVLAIALLVVVALRWWSRRLWWGALLATAALAAFFLWAGMEQVRALLITESLVRESNVRIEIYTNALRALADSPLYGIGIGMFPRIVPVLYPHADRVHGAMPHAHNLLLQIGMDLGLPGMIAYLALAINAVRVLHQVLQRGSAVNRTLAMGALGAFTALFLHGLVDAVTWGTKFAFVPWLLYALTAMVGRDLARRRPPAPQFWGRQRLTPAPNSGGDSAPWPPILGEAEGDAGVILSPDWR
jgi:O-antigen ligase